MVLPKEMRLKGYKCFEFLYKEGKRFYGRSMVLRVAKRQPKLEPRNHKEILQHSIKCAISISNKISKKAVVRNSLRRLFHNHLTLRLSNTTQIQNGNWAFISLKPKLMNPSFIYVEIHWAFNLILYQNIFRMN